MTSEIASIAFTYVPGKGLSVDPQNVEKSKIETLFNRDALLKFAMAMSTTETSKITFKASREQLTSASVSKISLAAIAYIKARHESNWGQMLLAKEQKEMSEGTYKPSLEFINLSVNKTKERAETLASSTKELEALKESTGINVEFLGD